MKGARIGILEARMTGALAEIVRRHGGRPVEAPAVREVPAVDDDAVRAFVEDLRTGRIRIVVFQTGVGVQALLKEAERLSLLSDLQGALHSTTNVCRGPKPAGILGRHRLPISVRVDEPHTTAEVLRAMEPLPVAEGSIGILHHGEPNTALTEGLQSRGADVVDLCLYEWRLPEDQEPLRRLVRAVVAREVDALAFTSQIQARHLVQVAKEIGLDAELERALGSDVVVAAVGPTCAEALRSLGIAPRVVPDHPRMAAMVAALAAHLADAEGRQRTGGSR